MKELNNLLKEKESDLRFIKEEFEDSKSHLEVILSDFNSDVIRLTKSYKDLNAKKETLESKLAQLSNSISSVSTQLDMARIGVTDTKKALADRETEYIEKEAGLLKQIDDLKAQLKAHNDKFKALESLIASTCLEDIDSFVAALGRNLVGAVKSSSGVVEVALDDYSTLYDYFESDKYQLVGYTNKEGVFIKRPRTIKSSKRTGGNPEYLHLIQVCLAIAGNLLGKQSYFDVFTEIYHSNNGTGTDLDKLICCKVSDTKGYEVYAKTPNVTDEDVTVVLDGNNAKKPSRNNMKYRELCGACAEAIIIYVVDSERHLLSVPKSIFYNLADEIKANSSVKFVFEGV